MISSTVLLATIFVTALILLAGMWLLFYQISQKLDQTTTSLLWARKDNHSKDILQRKLQAYERLSLLLERIKYPNVIKRCYDTDIKAGDLISRMKIDIDAEYEHNITQQIYVSEKLWEIIHLTKEDTINILNEISHDLESYQSDQVFIQALSDKLSQRDYHPVDKAQLAIRTEVQSLL